MSAATLTAALMSRAAAYRSAIERIRESVGCDDNDALAATRDLREAVELVRCLARLVDGRDVRELHAAFGAPGDFGYESEIGAALWAAYSSASETKGDAP
jgi:hypothetical protein